jgi:hypothetical protein
MESLYFWPENPAASITVLILLSMVFLWAARDPMIKMLRNLGSALESGFSAVSKWSATTAESL